MLSSQENSNNDAGISEWLGTQEDSYFEVLEKYRRLAAKLEGWLEGYNEQNQFQEQIVLEKTKNSQLLAAIECRNTFVSQQDPPPSSIRLPVLKLSSFDGQILGWQEFWDSYEGAIHNITSLNPVDKFNHLKSLLHGEAKAVIAGFALTNANYDMAVNLLKKRYGNDNVIKEEHFNALASLPVAKTPKMLKTVTMMAQQHIRSLEALHYCIDENETSLLAILKPKFIHFNDQLLFLKKTMSTSWKLEELLETASTLASVKVSISDTRSDNRFEQKSYSTSSHRDVRFPNSPTLTRKVTNPTAVALSAPTKSVFFAMISTGATNAKLMSM